MTTRPLVRNAGDPRQVRRAGKTEHLRRQDELNDLRAVLATAEGRRLLWRVLGHCGCFGSVWHPSALIHYNSGRQDVGHWLQAEINAASRSQFFRMIQEHWPDEEETGAEAEPGKTTPEEFGDE